MALPLCNGLRSTSRPGTLAAYAFARYEFKGRGIAFALVLVQLMIMPDILVVENYKTMARLGLVDTLVAIGLPYFASAFAIFLLRQTFMGIPKELDEAARVEGASAMQTFTIAGGTGKEIQHGGTGWRKVGLFKNAEWFRSLCLLNSEPGAGYQHSMRFCRRIKRNSSMARGIA